MNKFFLDSNVCVYALDKSDQNKQEKAFELLRYRCCISSQVVIETYNACKNKLKLSHAVCEDTVLSLVALNRIVEIKDTTLQRAVVLKRKYAFSFLDSVIVASALESNCTILYSEDMQHNQVIEGKLTIVNPFL